MTLSFSPTQSQIMAALRTNVLQAVLPQGSAMFSGSVTGTTLTASKPTTGDIVPDDVLFGQGVLPDTVVLSQLTGPTGGAGTYKLNRSQAVSGTLLNTGVIVVQGQGNRVAQPPAQDFVVMTPLRKPRLATNIDDYADCFFEGSLDGAGNLTAAFPAGTYGTVRIGSQVFGVGVDDGTVVLSQTSGVPGEAGVYAVTSDQTISAQGMACGVTEMTQETEVVIQLDFFGPNSADYSQVVSTVFRDQYGADLVATSGLPVSLLYADDPAQSPFVDGEQQYENRWRVEAYLQADITVVVPQQFADALSIDLVEVDAVYPP